MWAGLSPGSSAHIHSTARAPRAVSSTHGSIEARKGTPMTLISKHTLLGSVLAVVAVGALACGSNGGGASATATAAATTAATAAATATQVALPAIPTTGGPSSFFVLAGPLNVGVYKMAEVQALPVSKVSTNAKAGTGELGLHEYSGPLLYDLLMKAQPKLDAAKPNDAFRKSIVVTATDGYQTAIGWGEIDPKLGNKKILLAYQRDSAALPDADGFVRLVVPGDAAAGRYISNVAKIELRDVGTNPAVTSDRKPTTSVAVSGLIKNAGDLDAAKLGAMKQSTATVKDASGASITYGGVLLSDLVTAVVPTLDDKRKNDQLGFGVLGIGSNGYSALVVGGEWDTKFANAPILIATSQDGKPLAATDGFARLVVPNDAGTSRFISNLSKLEVIRLD